MFDPKKSAVSGLVVGGSLLLGICLSVLGGAGGILNPAVAGALKTVDPGYYIAQIAGAIIGFQLYAFLATHHTVKAR